MVISSTKIVAIATASRAGVHDVVINLYVLAVLAIDLGIANFPAVIVGGIVNNVYPNCLIGMDTATAVVKAYVILNERSSGINRRALRTIIGIDNNSVTVRYCIQSWIMPSPFHLRVIVIDHVTTYDDLIGSNSVYRDRAKNTDTTGGIHGIPGVVVYLIILDGYVVSFTDTYASTRKVMHFAVTHDDMVRNFFFPDADGIRIIITIEAGRCLPGLQVRLLGIGQGKRRVNSRKLQAIDNHIGAVDDDRIPGVTVGADHRAMSGKRLEGDVSFRRTGSSEIQNRPSGGSGIAAVHDIDRTTRVDQVSPLLDSGQWRFRG